MLHLQNVELILLLLLRWGVYMLEIKHALSRFRREAAAAATRVIEKVVSLEESSHCTLAFVGDKTH